MNTSLRQRYVVFQLSTLLVSGAAMAAEPAVRLSAGVGGPVSILSWDTEGTRREVTNLLAGPVAGATGEIVDGGGFLLKATADEVRLPFDPKVTPTCVIPSRWLDGGTFALPAIVNAPDFGPMVLTQERGVPTTGLLLGSRAERTTELRLSGGGVGAVYRFTPLHLPTPEGVDAAMWASARRGWLNAVQPTARWGEQGRPFSAPAGVLGNNVISDPASVSLWFYADQCFWIPEPTPGVSLMPTLRRSIDYWLDGKVRPSGEVVAYWDYGNFLDANASPLIAAWDYVAVTGDLDWLKSKIDRLEKVADFLLSRDVDGDGLIEATQSGNDNALQQPGRSCAWWDALNCGHKDAYTNALSYRALCYASDLSKRLGRDEAAARFRRQADRLREAFFPTLYNEKTGLLAWWKSADGMLHDYASPTTCGLAIEYGLVPPEEAKRIIDRLWKKMAEVKFDRFDLGVPPMLTPVRRADYLQPHAIGLPATEDGRDTFGVYMNGGITAGQVLHFINANYAVGRREDADGLLKAMLTRQHRGGFQNGVTDAEMKGIDWTTWDGKPSGYEGYLADSFRFLQAVLMREPSARNRLYRPMIEK